MFNIDLVPKTCWHNSVRDNVSPRQWDEIKKNVYAMYNYKCSICGGVGEKHPVEAHEIWSYDEVNKIQKLESIVALCPKCHEVHHFGLAKVNGRYKIALKHMMKVSGEPKKYCELKVKDAFIKFSDRSKYKWKLDIANADQYKNIPKWD